MSRVLIIATLLLSPALSLLGGKVANAWSGHLPPCTATMTVEEINEKITALSPAVTSWVWGNTVSSTNIVFYQQQGQLQLNDETGTLKITMPSGYIRDADWGGTTYDGDYGSLICINMVYNVSFTGSTPYPQYNATTPPEEPTDVCPNIAGVQSSMPQGYHDEGGQCIADTITPPNDPPAPTGEITFIQKISAVFALFITVFIAYQFRFQRHD